MNARGQVQGYIQVSGKQPVSEALGGGWPVKEVFLRSGTDDPFTRQIAKKASSLGVRVSVTEARAFDKRFPRQSQGVAAAVREVPLVDLDEVFDRIPPGQVPLFVALDGIEDPHNLGAVTRTALAMGVHAVVIPRRRTAAVGEGAAKASAGAVFLEPVCQVPNIHYLIEWARRKGLWVFGLDAGGQDTIWGTDMSGPSVLIVGGEGKGLARLTRDKCDFLVRIPMLGEIGSLNASVACGMALSEIRRQRLQKASKNPET